MCRWIRVAWVAVLLAVVGCGKPSTARLIEDLKAPESLTRLKAVRTLPERKDDAAQVVPALIEALKDEDAGVRRGAAFGLGSFGEQARDSIPALQAALKDREPDVRRAAGVALSCIDPKLAPESAPNKPRKR
jgi:HEAT repeat protein